MYFAGHYLEISETRDVSRDTFQRGTNGENAGLSRETRDVWSLYINTYIIIRVVKKSTTFTMPSRQGQKPDLGKNQAEHRAFQVRTKTNIGKQNFSLHRLLPRLPTNRQQSQKRKPKHRKPSLESH